jgi:hypothetical protein
VNRRLTNQHHELTFVCISPVGRVILVYNWKRVLVFRTSTPAARYLVVSMALGCVMLMSVGVYSILGQFQEYRSIPSPSDVVPTGAGDVETKSESQASDARPLQDLVKPIMDAITAKTHSFKPEEKIDPAVIASELMAMDRTLEAADDPFDAASIIVHRFHADIMARCGMTVRATQEYHQIMNHTSMPAKKLERAHLVEFIFSHHLVEHMDALLKETRGDPLAQQAEVQGLEMWDLAVHVRTGRPFPDFSIIDTAGVLHQRQDYAGKILAIFAWSSRSLPCVRMVPDLVKLYERYHDHGLECLGISCSADRHEDDPLLRIMPWPQVSSRQQWPVAPIGPFGIDALPAILLVSPSGVLLGKWSSLNGIVEAITPYLEGGISLAMPASSTNGP